MSGRWKVIAADRVFDGVRAALRERTLVVIEGDTIREIGSPSEVQPPSGPDVEFLQVPATSTLLPGLIDTHTHLTMNGSGIPLPTAMQHDAGILLLQASASARTHLLSGVTTVVDAGASGSTSFTLRDAAQLGLAQTPRLKLAGRPITRTGGHAWSSGTEADGPEEVRVAARQMLKEGADFIKIMATGGGTPGTYPHRPSYRLDELAVAAEEAHAVGTSAIAHCSATEGIRRCLDAGIDIIFHCHFYEADGTLRFDPEVARRLADSPVYVNPTLWINGGRWDVLRRKAEREGLSDDEQRMLEQRTRRYMGQRENVGRLAEYGVKLIAGTDAGFAIYPFGDLVTELEEMVICGMSAPDVLLSATRIAAEALGMGQITGTLEPGRKADLIVVDGDPTSDIAALRNVQAIVLGGDLVKRDGLVMRDR